MTEQMEMVVRGLIGIAKTHGKTYCWVAQINLQTLLERFEHWNMSERSLRRRLKDLEDEGYIKITHRNWTEENGSKKFRCNMYEFTKKFFLWLQKLADYARKVFSHFRRPKLADYSSKTIRRDLERTPTNVEILWKSPIKGRASPSKAF